MRPCVGRSKYSITLAVEFNTKHLCWTEVRHRQTEGRWHAHRIASNDLGLTIYLDELTPDEILQVTGESDSSTPSTLTGQQICEWVKEAVMLRSAPMTIVRLRSERSCGAADWSTCAITYLCWRLADWNQILVVVVLGFLPIPNTVAISCGWCVVLYKVYL